RSRCPAHRRLRYELPIHGLGVRASSRVVQTYMRISRFVSIALVIVAGGLSGCAKDHDAPPAATATATTPAPRKPPKDPAEARALIAKGATVVDVRTPDEFAAGHLETAKNVPVEDLANRLGEVDQLVGGDKTKPVVVYCASGHRAGKAKEQLEAAGYAHVVNGGGYYDLK
ncbi:MAG: rhodanese-like domain-containing protein, partial [Kofleriaceae bacterium]